jgi:Flp pilus assembly protein TadG
VTRPQADDGAAVVDFVLVSVLVVALFLVALQVGLVLHARNVLVSAAQEGARHAANADVTDLNEAAVIARESIATGLSSSMAAGADIPTPTLVPVGAGQQAVQVTITAKIPSVVWVVGSISVTVRGHALREGAG